MDTTAPSMASIDKVIEKIKKDEEKEEKTNKIFTAIMQKTTFLREENNRLTCKLEALEQQTDEARMTIAIKQDEIRFQTMENKILEELHSKLAKENEKKSRELEGNIEDFWDIRRKYIARVRQKIEKIKSKTPDPVEMKTLREMLEGTYGKPKTPPPSPIREHIEEDDDEMVRLLDELERQNELQRQSDSLRKNAEMQRQNELVARQVEVQRQEEMKRQTMRQTELQRQRQEEMKRKTELTTRQTELQRQRQDEIKRQNELKAKQAEIQHQELEEQRRKNELASQKMDLKRQNELQRQLNIEDEMQSRITEYNSALSQQRRWQSNSGTCASDNLAMTRAPPRPPSQSNNATRTWSTMQTARPVTPAVPTWQNRAPIGRGLQTFERNMQPSQPQTQPNSRAGARPAAPLSQSVAVARGNVPSFSELMSGFDEPPDEGRREEPTSRGVFKFKKPSQFYRQQSF